MIKKKGHAHRCVRSTKTSDVIVFFTKMNAAQADTMMQVRGGDYASWLHVALYNGVN